MMTNDQAALLAAATSERGHSVQQILIVAGKYAAALDTGLFVAKDDEDE